MNAVYKGKVRDKNGYAVHLFYEYRGHEYNGNRIFNMGNHNDYKHYRRDNLGN